MAGLSLPTFAYEQILNAPLAAVDAEMVLYHQVNRDNGLSVSRVENIPGRLVVYVVTKYALTQEYGDCGRLFIQFLDEKKTRLSFDLAAPDKAHAARFSVEGTLRMLGGPKPERLTPDEFARGSAILSQLRFQVLKEICDTLQTRLAPFALELPANVPSPAKNLSPNKGGRPGLSEAERLRRLALVLLEQRLKQNDPGLTRGEFVFQVQQKLNLPLEMHTLKNAAKLLERARAHGETDLLAQAETQAAEWQRRFT
jgi:hypothetical protein